MGGIYEMEPKSPIGQAVAVLMMSIGVLFMAMPIAIVGSCFSQTWFDQDRIILMKKFQNRISQHGYTVDDLQEVFDEVDEETTGHARAQSMRHREHYAA